MLMPFIIGFAIAFLLHPFIMYLSKHGHQTLYSTIVILIFYAVLGFLLSWLSIKGFYYIQSWTNRLPLLYVQYIEPYLNTSFSSVESVWKSFDINSAQVVSSIMQSLQSSLLSLVNTISKSLLSGITNIVSSIPRILLSFFFAILSSFYINKDYTNIINFLKRNLPSSIQYYLNSTQIFIRTTLKHLCIAYVKLMVMTLILLSIGLTLIGVKNALWIALGIALFDIVPVLGCGGILLPWILISWINHQDKLAVGLLILYITISMIRGIVEPKIVGKQIGLHPLLMLFCMYIGGKIFGALGIIILPFLLLIAEHLWKEKNKFDLEI